MDVTFSKQCIHFLRSLRWPPTSNMLHTILAGDSCIHPVECAYCIDSWPMWNLVSYIPVVFVRARKTSDSTGMYSGSAILITSSKKLWALACKQGQVGREDVLRGRVHQVELARVLEHL